MLKKTCEYYPCHDNLEDCTYCYCPAYPCEDENLGDWADSNNLKPIVWDCSNCNLFHQSKVVRAIQMLHKKDK